MTKAERLALSLALNRVVTVRNALRSFIVTVELSNLFDGGARTVVYVRSMDSHEVQDAINKIGYRTERLSGGKMVEDGTNIEVIGLIGLTGEPV